jgi:hypothetical protein
LHCAYYDVPALAGTTMDVGEWLRGLGLDQYEQKFRENKVDAEVLPQLTARGLQLAVRARYVAALAVIACLLPIFNPSWDQPYYLVMLGLFAI